MDSEIYKVLKDAGIEEEKAIEVAESIQAKQIATKTEMKKTDGQIAETKSELETDIEKINERIGEIKSELETDIEKINERIGGVKSELKTDIEIGEIKSELKTDIEKINERIREIQLRIEEPKIDAIRLNKQLFLFQWMNGVILAGVVVLMVAVGALTIRVFF